MTSTRSIIAASLCCLLLTFTCASQQSDFTVKRNFETRYKELEMRLDSAKTVAELDTLKILVDSLGMQYAPREAFLDKALYPETFAGKMNDLHGRHILTYDRIYLIRNQGYRISELEARIAVLSGRLDSLTADRDQLFSELQEARKNVQSLREAVRRLTSNLSLKDKLIFALVDSIFLPYDKNLNQVSEMQKEAISRKLEKANVVSRVYEFASDNVKFLEVTQLQAKDYANLIDQYQQFRSKWDGLSDKMNAVAAASEPRIPGTEAAKPTAGGRGAVSRTAAPPPRAQVDSILTEWNKKLQAAFWAGLQKEFTVKQLTVLPFTDAASFSSSMRAYVEAVKQSGQDASVFADDVWKERIDKEWREALSKETMLGKTEYASLDKLVSELSKEKVDLRFLIYALGVVVLALAIWWFLFRKPKTPPTGRMKAA